jgi:hypothetical protein
MTESLNPAYLKKIGQRGRISIWIVDGSYIRMSIDEEFTNFGQHYKFRYVPKDEFWIDRGASPEEQKIYIDHLLVEHRLMEKGLPYDQALDAADKAERSERKRAGYSRKVAKSGNLPDASQVHIRLWKKLETSVSVWIVDGRLVRSIFDVDFTEGGHDYVYEFVPLNEVWIEGDVEEAERPFILVHELHERNLMAQGWDYDQAHLDASRIEYYCRHHPEELHESLVKENW